MRVTVFPRGPAQLAGPRGKFYFKIMYFSPFFDKILIKFFEKIDFQNFQKFSMFFNFLNFFIFFEKITISRNNVPIAFLNTETFLSKPNDAERCV